MEAVWEQWEKWRGSHDFNVDPILYLPHGVQVYCSEGTLEGILMLFIQGRIAGYPATATVLDMCPRMRGAQ